MLFLDAFPGLAERLKIELTERTIISTDRDIQQTIAALRDQNIETALNDFSTGSTSLDCISDFPLNTIKIDRRFVSNIAITALHSVVVSSILKMACTFNRIVVAEGVGTREDATKLNELGWTHAQVNFFGKPSPRLSSVFTYPRVWRSS